MSYRAKKESETWNQYLINIFREKKKVNFVEFLDKYFKDEARLEEYQNGIKQEKEKRVEKVSEVKEDSSPENKTTFAKKPERLKRKKKGYLF